jgi:hypothetical protein
MPSACPPTPRMEWDGCPSWGSAALRGHRAPSLGRSLVPSDPYGVPRPSGSQLEAAPPRRSEVVGPPCAFAPLQRSSESHPRTVPPTTEAMCKPTRCLSWTLLPYDTCQRSGVHDGDASDVAANHVRGLATPFAVFTTRSRDRRLLSKPRAYRHHEGVGASMGFLLQGFPLEHGRYLFRSPCLLAGSTRRSPTRGWKPRRAAAFKALFPRRVRSHRPGSRTNPETAAKRRSLLGVHCSPEHVPTCNQLAL